MPPINNTFDLIHLWVYQMNIQEKERIEIDFWKNSPTESPTSDSLENIIAKFSESRILLEKVEFFHSYFQNATTVLELGAGQGWASCMIKRLFPHLHITTSDISEHAIASISKWEYLLQVQVDHRFSCRSYEIPLPDESLDLMFCFEAAHHFVKHRRTLQEIYRVLKPGGTCLYLHEHSCKGYIYKLAYARVNRKRPEVPEDVLIYPKICKIAQDVGLTASVRFDTTTTNRGVLETMYYAILQKFPVLAPLLTCTGDFILHKPTLSGDKP